MDKIRVLLAEDELSLAHIVRESLEVSNFEVILCANGEQALQKYKANKPHILALDVMMPKMDGFEVARQVRLIDKITPIIFLTARSQPKDVVAGFEHGANDYLKKPFSVEELIVRMRVLLSDNRLLVAPKAKPVNENYQIGSIVFNSSKNNIQQGINITQLTARESDILKMLCADQYQVINRKALLQTIWGDDSFFNARSLDVFITKLRRHLAIDPNIQIINIRGVGYKLVW
ncbi:DNA-binding response regulator, OmpR family, contains REC and winged-helix (wHTH) domain [Mucilaginibacter pineti]|uniref:DNA-binding response regulator, OmpR family, contains REC and winged-helix (WHTH) domain n=1 Tax=Mucilaginibacter pineti TaxID=1391627 RepID=A0A1G6XQ53_9SPHI|nr:response regulator transcription factor [Mucilaginibacter pineti]SDD80308.1 DNA-binding response regulator, OmpR family, contains REC and winged-helix (wHTH) domain [Mucilaginibacter pineti]